MCGNIKRLRFAGRVATAAEIDAAVLQFVRKISDMRMPSELNRPVFEKACASIAISVRKLLDNVEPRELRGETFSQFKRID